MNEFKVCISNVCGSERAYPTSDLADLFLELFPPQKTFTKGQLETIAKIAKELDIELEIETED